MSDLLLLWTERMMHYLLFHFLGLAYYAMEMRFNSCSTVGLEGSLLAWMLRKTGRNADLLQLLFFKDPAPPNNNHNYWLAARACATTTTK
jgi:hypothetical protein